MISFLKIPRDAAERMYLLGPAPRYRSLSEYRKEQSMVKDGGMKSESNRVSELVVEFCNQNGEKTPLAKGDEEKEHSE